LREIDDVLAAVIYRVKVSQNLSSTKNPIFDLLEQTVAEFTQNAHLRQDPKLRFTIYHAVSRILLARNDYKTLESYLLATFEEFNNESLFGKANHDTKLQMLVYIVNTLYNTRKLEMSLDYAELLRHSMEEHGRMLYQKYLMYYYNALIINYSILNPPKATEIVERVIKDRTFKESPYNEFLMIINLAICYFNERKFGKALKALVGLYIHDGYAGAGMPLRMRIGIFELTLRVESGDFEITEKRIDDLRKEFSNLLGTDGQSTENQLIQLMEEMNNSLQITTDKELREKVSRFIATTPREELERFSFIDYQDWLNRKIGIEDNMSA
jgi:tetratricopeptide (TPR) repeat protein